MLILSYHISNGTYVWVMSYQAYHFFLFFFLRIHIKHIILWHDRYKLWLWGGVSHVVESCLLWGESHIWRIYEIIFHDIHFSFCTKEMHDKLKFVQLKISHMTQKKKKKKKGQIMQDKEKSYLYISLLHIFYMYCWFWVNINKIITRHIVLTT